MLIVGLVIAFFWTIATGPAFEPERLQLRAHSDFPTATARPRHRCTICGSRGCRALPPAVD